MNRYLIALALGAGSIVLMAPPALAAVECGTPGSPAVYKTVVTPAVPAVYETVVVTPAKPAVTETIEHPAITHEETITVTDKEAWTETVVIEEAYWQRYSLTGGPHESEAAPSFPSTDWQPNVKGDPHGIGEEGAYFVSNGNSGNGDWFYLDQVDAVTDTVEHPAVTHEETVIVVDKEAWTETVVIEEAVPAITKEVLKTPAVPEKVEQVLVTPEVLAGPECPVTDPEPPVTPEPPVVTPEPPVEPQPEPGPPLPCEEGTSLSAGGSCVPDPEPQPEEPVKPEPAPEPEPTEPTVNRPPLTMTPVANPTTVLPNTGAEDNLALGGLAGLLILAGGALMRRGSRA